MTRGEDTLRTPLGLPRALAVLLATLALAALVLALPPRPALADEPELEEAEAAAIMDSYGRVLWSVDGDSEYALASITKVMSAMVALDAGIDWDQSCTYHEVGDLPESSQRAGYEDGSSYSFEELMSVMLVYSANDAAETVAYAVAGGNAEFAALMNQKADEIGLEHSHFANPHGHEAEGHYSSALDLVTMGRYALMHYPFIAETVCLDEVTVDVNGTDRTFESTDHLLGQYEGMRGIKTGSVAAGTTFLGACTRDGITLYTAVLGCDTQEGRFEDTEAMLDWAWSHFRRVELADPEAILDIAPCAENFCFSYAVHPASDASFVYWDLGEDLTYQTTIVRDDLYLMADQVCGTTVWRQGDITIAGCEYVCDIRMEPMSGFGVFERPLFGDDLRLAPEPPATPEAEG